MTSQGHHWNKQIKNNTEGHFFIHQHLKKFCASIFETAHTIELRDPKQYDVKVWW